MAKKLTPTKESASLQEKVLEFKEYRLKSMFTVTHSIGMDQKRQIFTIVKLVK
jgi:hypothetical protein